jgi:hypothetical protein
MTVRGKKVGQIILERTELNHCVQVIAHAEDGDVLFQRYMYAPFWHDRFERLVQAIERQLK